MENITETKNLALIIFGLLVSALCIYMALALIYRQYLFISSKKLTTSINQLLQHETSERHSVATYLHDTVLSDLAALKIYIAVAQRKDFIAEDIYTERFNQCIENAIESVRNVQYTLTPPQLENGNIAAALRFYYKNAGQKTAIEFEINQENNLKVPQYTAYGIYKTLLDILNIITISDTLKKCSILLHAKENDCAVAELLLTGSSSNLLKKEIRANESSLIQLFNVKPAWPKLIDENTLLLKFKIYA